MLGSYKFGSELIMTAAKSLSKMDCPSVASYSRSEHSLLKCVQRLPFSVQRVSCSFLRRSIATMRERFWNRFVSVSQTPFAVSSFWTWRNRDSGSEAAMTCLTYPSSLIHGFSFSGYLIISFCLAAVGFQEGSFPCAGSSGFATSPLR